MKNRTLRCESLEDRIALSAAGVIEGGRLVIRGSQVNVTEADGIVTVSNDGRESAFRRDEIRTMTITGTPKDDRLENRTSIPSIIYGLNGDDIIRGGSADDILFGGNGNDIINDFGGNNLLNGGNGNDILQSVSSGRDVFVGGNGNDQIYAIVGEPNLIQSGNGQDTIIVRLGVDLTDASKQDNVIAFDLTEKVALRDGVLYVNGGGTTLIRQFSDQLLVSVDGVTQAFPSKGVFAIAGIASQGNDTFINTTAIDSIYYGIGGDDLLIGGSGNDLLKGGAGNDIIIGGDGDDDIAGDGGSNIIVGGKGRNILRVSDVDQVISERGDVLIVA